LVAPSGLVRTTHITWKSRLLYSTAGILPEGVVQWMVRRRLQGGPVHSNNTAATGLAPAPAVKPGDADDPIAAELGGVAPPSASSSAATPAPPTGPSSFDAAPLFPHRPLVTVASAVAWQLQHHAGFIPAFVSSIRFGPIHDQAENWRRIGGRLAAQREGGGAEGEGLQEGKVLMVLGRTDPIILREEIVEDAEGVLGREGVEVCVLEAGHEVCLMRCACCCFGEGEVMLISSL